MEDIQIRRMQDTDTDYQLMLQWLSKDSLLKYYEGRDKKFDLEKIKKKYSPRVLGLENVLPFIFSLNGNPIGYIQCYELSKKQKTDFELDNNKKIFGVDMFIGDDENRGKGLGTKVLKEFINMLLNEYKADSIIVDPRAGNPRAIKSYEKVGFKQVKILPKHDLHEGEYHDVHLMIYPD